MIQWRVIEADPNYEVSSEGGVRRAIDGPHTAAGRVLRPVLGNTGYRVVCLRPDGVSKQLSVHRLVAIAFLGQPAAGQVVRHLDGNPENNHVENLRWGSQAENIADAIAHGTYRCAKAEQTHCARGHEMAGSNLITRKSSKTKSGFQRTCRECHVASQRRYEAKRRIQFTINDRGLAALEG